MWVGAKVGANSASQVPLGGLLLPRSGGLLPSSAPDRRRSAACKSVAKASKVRILHPPQAGLTSTYNRTDDLPPPLGLITGAALGASVRPRPFLVERTPRPDAVPRSRCPPFVRWAPGVRARVRRVRSTRISVSAFLRVESTRIRRSAIRSRGNVSGAGGCRSPGPSDWLNVERVRKLGSRWGAWGVLVGAGEVRGCSAGVLVAGADVFGFGGGVFCPCGARSFGVTGAAGRTILWRR